MKPVPKPLESIAGLLIPPACREHVLGDLHERYENPRQYILDAILTIPLVVLSRIRRTTDHQVLLVESCALFIAFLIAAWQGDTGFPGLAIPALAVLAGLRLGDAYAERHRSPWTPVVGVAFAYLSQAVVWLANPALLVPGPIMLKAAGMSLFLIAVARMSFQAGPQETTFASNASMSVDELRRKAQKLEKRIYRRNLREYAAAIFVIAVFAWKTAVSTVAFERIGSGLVVACTLYVVYHLHRKGSPGTARPDTAFAPLLDFYRTELERQRDLL